MRDTREVPGYLQVTWSFPQDFAVFSDETVSELLLIGNCSQSVAKNGLLKNDERAAKTLHPAPQGYGMSVRAGGSGVCEVEHGCE